ncbi:MAG: DNA-3-methyladenine glycosylase [Isosphaeraceae bacterium]
MFPRSLRHRNMKRFARAFYDRDPRIVACELLGTLLTHRVRGVSRVGRVVETEAYLGPHDLAAHSSRGRTQRTEVMFGPPGFAYVYLIYGIHHCLNAVTEGEGQASAVLIRALEPVANVEGKTTGPGLLCKAMGIDRTLNGHDLVRGDLSFSAPEKVEPFTIVSRPRVGVAYAKEWSEKPFRYYIEGNRFISRP